MQGSISIKNSSQYPVLTVYCDDTIICSDVLIGHNTKFYTCPAGSRKITVSNNYGRVIFDLWLSIAPRKKHTLELFTDSFQLLTHAL